MKKFTIEEYVIDNQYDGNTRIKLTLKPNVYLLTEDIKGLKETIENIDSRPDDKYSQSMMDQTFAKYFCKENGRFSIKKVILHNPATIVFWYDGTKTVVKCQDGDIYSPEVGIAMCYMKKALGNQSNFNNTFKKHIPEQSESVDNGKKKSTRSYSHLNSEAVYRILRENKSSVAELARSVGVDKTAVYSWLRGGGIKRRNISKLVKVLHVPEEVIIKEEK